MPSRRSVWTIAGQLRACHRQKTREAEHFSLGVSPRGSQMLYRAAQAMAFLDGRTFCTPEDFKPLVVPVFAHRVVVNGLYSSTLKKSEQAEQVIQEIVDGTPCRCRNGDSLARQIIA